MVESSPSPVSSSASVSLLVGDVVGRGDTEGPWLGSTEGVWVGAGLVVGMLEFVGETLGLIEIVGGKVVVGLSVGLTDTVGRGVDVGSGD